MARKNPAWVIVDEYYRLVGTEAYHTRIRAEQELTSPEQRVIRLNLVGGTVRKYIPFKLEAARPSEPEFTLAPPGVSEPDWNRHP